MVSRAGQYDAERDLVVSPGYRGPCRRHSSEAERERFRQEHPNDRPWHAHIPRPLLVTAVLCLAGLLGWFEVRWRDSVEDRLGGVGNQILEMRKDWLEDARRAAQRDGDREYVRRLDHRLQELEAQSQSSQPPAIPSASPKP